MTLRENLPEQKRWAHAVLDDVREARLAPVVDFKGRRKPAAAQPAQEQPRPENDAQDTE